MEALHCNMVPVLVVLGLIAFFGILFCVLMSAISELRKARAIMQDAIAKFQPSQQVTQSVPDGTWYYHKVIKPTNASAENDSEVPMPTTEENAQGDGNEAPGGGRKNRDKV